MPASDPRLASGLRPVALLTVALSFSACERGRDGLTATVACGSAAEDAATTCTIAASDDAFPPRTLTCALDGGTTCVGAVLEGCSSVVVPGQGETAGPGSCTVAIAVSDGAGGSALALGTLTIEDANAPPTVEVVCASADEDAAGSCSVTASDADFPTQTITCALDGATTCAGAVLTGCATVAIPPQGESAGPGSCTVVVSASDGRGGTVTGSSTHAIGEVNGSPIAAVTCGSAAEDASTTCTIETSDPDVPVQSLTCTLGAATTCTGAVLEGCSSVTVPAQGEAQGPGSCAVAIDVSDGGGGSALALGTLTIEEANAPPAVEVVCTSAEEGAAGSCSVAASDADFPAQTLTCALDGATTCAGAVLTGCTSVTVPAQGETAGPGSCTVAVSASDGWGGNVTASSAHAITEVNRSPVATVTCGSAAEDAATTCAIEASDPDVPVQSLTCSLGAATTCSGVVLEGCSSAAVPAQGEAEGPGSCAVAIDATDGGGGSVLALGTLTIEEANLPPEFSTSLVAARAYLGVATDVSAGVATDPDLPAQPVTCSKGPSSCSAGVTVAVTGSGAGTASCTLSFTAAAKESCSVSVLATDSFDAVAVTTVAIEGVRNCTWTGTGSISTSWNTTSNWSCGFVPGDGDRANVPAGAPRYPSVSGAVRVGVLELNGTLSVAAGASLDVTRSASLAGTVTNAGTLTLPALDASTMTSGTLVNTGTLVVRSGDVVVASGVTLVEDGNLRGSGLAADTIASLTVESGGVLTHSRGVLGGLALTVSGALDVKGSGKIDVSSKGYRGGRSDGNGSLSGETRGDGGTPSTSGGALNSAGASYGGSGGSGNSSYEGVTNATYGDPLAPDDLGSGGGTYYSWIGGGNGGGKVKIACGSATVNGQVLADGGAAGAASGGGSGGSVVLTVMGGSFSGAGTIQALGGAASSDGGAGGRGRIAVVGYGTKAFSGTIAGGSVLTRAASALGELALASASQTVAAASTLAVDSVALQSGGQLTLSSSGALTLPALRVAGGTLTNGGTLTLGALTMSGGTLRNQGTLTLPAFDATTMTGGELVNQGTLVVESPAVVVGAGATLFEDGDLHASGMAADTVGSLTVASGGVLTHLGGSLGGLAITVAGPLDVQLGGKIDVSSKGYRGGNRDGNPSADGETRGAGGVATTSGGARRTAGGSYGGNGSRGGSSYGATNATYGDPFLPDDLGSGGGADYGAGGSGGGKVKIVCERATINGQVLADGGGGSGTATGAGSGGTIALTLSGGALSGSTGIIRAAGGGPWGSGGAGGGGRIAITGYGSSTFPPGRISAGSVVTIAEGSAGELSLASAYAVPAGRTTLDSVTLFGGGALTTPGALTLGALRIEGGALTNAGTLTLGTLAMSGGTLSNGGTLTVSSFTASGTVVNTGTLTMPALNASTMTAGTFTNGGTLVLGSSDVVVGSGVTLAEDGDLHVSEMAADTVGSLTVQSGGVLTHSRGLLGGLTLNVAGALDVQEGGRIDVSSKGYRGASRDGLGGYCGETRGVDGAATTSGGACLGAGGSYGGSGGPGYNGDTMNATYGDPLAPDDLGSGGGTNSPQSPAGNGGGKVKIACGSAIVNGQVLADGGWAGQFCGGGSGGTIVLTSGGPLEGAGTIRAAGGSQPAVSSPGGAGGGGRVVVGWTGTASSFTGTTSAPGHQDGTVHVTVTAP